MVHKTQARNGEQSSEGAYEPNSSSEGRGPTALILGILLVYGLLWHLNVLLRLLGVRIGPDGPPSVLIWNWLAVMGTLGFIFLFERRSLDSIGLRSPSGRDALWAVAFWIVGLVLTSLVHSLVPPPPSPGLDVMLGLSIPILVGVVATASITEEVMFRGFLIERLGELTGRLWIGALISSVLFIVPHVMFFGPMWLMYHSYTTFLLYALYLWRRNLVSCIILHLLSNMLILLPALGVE